MFVYIFMLISGRGIPACTSCVQPQAMFSVLVETGVIPAYDSVVCFLTVGIKKTCEQSKLIKYKFTSQIFGIFLRHSHVY